MTLNSELEWTDPVEVSRRERLGFLRARRPGRGVILATCMLLAVMVALVRLLFVRGFIAPVRIDGSSMAEAFQGTGYQIRCVDCGISFRCDPEHLAEGELAACQNCGFRENVVDSGQLEPGERVLVDRLASRIASLQRWDVVAFREPGAADSLAVKRVVGFPGERIEIQRGDLVADGVILRKSLEQLRQVAILVHDDHFRPRMNGLPRWAGDAPDSQWETTATGYHCNGPEETTDWLTYRHRLYTAGVSPVGPREVEAPIVDDYGINPRLSRIRLNDVSDLLLSCKLSISGAGETAIRLHSGRGHFQVNLSPATRSAQLLRDVRPLATGRLPADFSQGRSVELAVCDQQVLFAVDGQVVIQHPFDADDQPWQPTSRPLAIGARGVQVTVRLLRVFRDVHYVHPRGDERNWSSGAPLRTNELLLLGDNSPLSADSRLWNPPGVPEHWLVGQVWKLHARKHQGR